MNRNYIFILIIPLFKRSERGVAVLADGVFRGVERKKIIRLI